MIAVVIVYETGQEMRRQADAERVKNPQDASAVPVESAQAAVRSYYRSHKLPASWTVGRTNVNGSDELEVSIYFLPRIGSSRYGQEAPPDDITATNACPLGEASIVLIKNFSLTILVNDKTGVINKISC